MTYQEPQGTLLVVGASGSIGQHVVAEAVHLGVTTRALIRDSAQADLFPSNTQIALGNFTDPESLAGALVAVDKIVFTHGTYGGEVEAEAVNYGAVRNVLSELSAPARIVLMTTIGVTKPSPGHDWKRRGERLVRASGLPYTIVRPGWFDYNEPNQRQIVMLQGDTRWAGDPADGAISRTQIAQVLVASLLNPSAQRKTFELIAESGPAPSEFTPLFERLRSDEGASLDGVLDKDNLPLAKEPARVIDDLEAIKGRF